MLALYSPAHAQNATWDLNPSSQTWNNPFNWTPPPAPTGTATFGPSSITTLIFVLDTSVGTLQFNPGAPPYTLQNGFVHNLFITGTGIVNNSSSDQTIITINGTTQFQNMSTGGMSTGGNVVILTDGSGVTEFHNTSTGGNAVITTQGGGVTKFLDSSNGGNATITINDGGVVKFFNESTGGKPAAIFPLTGS